MTTKDVLTAGDAPTAGDALPAECALSPAPEGPILRPAEPVLPSGERPRPPGLPLPPALLTVPLAELEFVVVDVETTGWQPGQDSITEIGAVRLSGGRLRAEYCTLVNPGSAIPAGIAALTGITDAMAGQAPAISEALPGFLGFARGSVLTAHNAAFDVGFLSAACGACGVSWPDFPVLDTVTLARLVLGAAEVPDCKLRTLADFFVTHTLPCHRALPDAMATAEVLQGLLRRLAVTGVAALAELGDGWRGQATAAAAADGAGG